MGTELILDRVAARLKAVAGAWKMRYNPGEDIIYVFLIGRRLTVTCCLPASVAKQMEDAAIDKMLEAQQAELARKEGTVV